MELKDWIRLLMLASVWGCSFFLVEIALRGAGPLTIMFVRVSVAAAALHSYCRIRGLTVWPDRRRTKQLIFMGFIANALPFSLIALGQTQIDSGLAAIFIATAPIFTVAIAHLWGRAETATAAKITGVTTGLAGVAVLMGPLALTGFSGGEWGKVAVLAAAFCYALSAVFGRRFRDLPPAAVAAWMLTAATIMMAPFAFIFETPFAPLPGITPLAAVLALALLSTAFAYILYFTILASAGATNVMLVTFIQPPLAIMLGTVFLGEILEWHQLGGLTIILLGLTLVDGRIVQMAGARLHRAGRT